MAFSKALLLENEMLDMLSSLGTFLLVLIGLCGFARVI